MNTLTPPLQARRALLASLASITLATVAAGDVIRVDPNSPNDGPGNDWDHAYHSLSHVLANIASPSDEIRVAQGTHKPTGVNSPFTVNDNDVQIKGGYPGLNQRDGGQCPPDE